MEFLSCFFELKVKEVIEDVLDQNFNGYIYEVVFCKEMSKKFFDIIK